MIDKATMHDRVRNLVFQKEHVPSQFQQTVFQLRSMVMDDPVDPEIRDLRDEFYGDWTNDDLWQLLYLSGAVDEEE